MQNLKATHGALYRVTASRYLVVGSTFLPADLAIARNRGASQLTLASSSRARTAVFLLRQRVTDVRAADPH